jgi:hypothetical protein
MKTIIIRKELPGPLKIVLLMSGCIIYSLILFYFDEGRKSLDGILKAGNPGAIVFYFSPMLAFTVALYLILKKSLGTTTAGIIATLTGPPAGFALIIGLFWFTAGILRFF